MLLVIVSDCRDINGSANLHRLPILGYGSKRLQAPVLLLRNLSIV